ncbi:MAG TPA: 50S ribosomal protein L24 [Gemmataceae bacterium]|nr:50S ribosomal protein L24 [Gemmataceae bacterium]
MHIKKDDIVEVLTGEDKGKRGRVLSVDHSENKVVVEGANRVYKHLKPNRRNQQGGRLSKEMPIDASNLALICPQTGKATRVGIRYLADGSKERFSKRSGAAMGRVSGPRDAYAHE